MYLRKAKLADLNTILSWVPSAFECKMWAGPKVKFPLDTGRLAEEIGFADDNGYGLIDNASMVAFGQVIVKKNGFHHLARIIVDPTKRSSGYGKYLCNALIQKVSQDGHQKFSLNVYPNNTIALNLYKALGFQEVVQVPTTEYCHLIKT